MSVAFRTAPPRLRGAVALTAGCAVLLVVVSVLRAALASTPATALVVPLVLGVAELAAAGALLAGVAAARALAGAALFLTGLLHLVIALGEAAWWVRTVSVVVLLASLAAGLLLAVREGEPA